MNPRAAINDLLPFQGSPFSLLGTSPNKLTNKRYSISIPVDTAEKVGFEPTAPCGVTGFQDQLLKPLGHLSITVLLYQIGPIISRIYCSNLTYVSPELNDAPWFHAVDISELCARIINRLNYGKSIAKYMDATRIIHDLLNE